MAKFNAKAFNLFTEVRALAAAPAVCAGHAPAAERQGPARSSVRCR